MKGDFCDIPNGRLHYLVKGAGTPLVFIHGFCLDLRMWESQMKFFSDHFTCIAVDLRGFGLSSVPTTEAYFHHEDINTLLEFLNITVPVVLAGQSMGARVIADYGLSYPEKTKALVVVDGTIGGYHFKNFDLSYIYDAGKKTGIQTANQLWLNHPLYDQARKNPVVFARLTEILMSYSGWHWIHKNPVKNIEPMAIERLTDLKMPALVICGQHDIQDFQDIADLLNTRILNAEKFIIQQAGHMSNMEQPEVFNKIVLEFLNDRK